MLLTSIAVEEVGIKVEDQQASLKSFSLTVSSEGEIVVLQNFLNSLLNQRRIKSIESISVAIIDEVGEEDSKIFTITMIVKGAYL